MTQSHNQTNYRLMMLALLVVLFVSNSVAIAQKKAPLTEHYVLDRIRILYSNEGIDAVTPDDADKNGVPDQVEDIAKQLWAAHKLFCDALKFPDPFESERYPGVTCIQVSLRELGGGNGLAFESAQRAVQIPEGKPSDRCLVMAINCKLNPIKNGTPAHEMFHLIQYSATYLKKAWYLEGQARWSEHALAKEGLGDIKYSPTGPWPQKREHLAQLAGMSYDAEFVLWNPIASRTDRDGLLTDEILSQEITALRYSDGSRVLADRSLYGAKIMREILIELGKQDDVAFKDLGYEDWSEENQTSEKNNPYIYKAIMDVLRRHDSSVGSYVVPDISD